MLLYSVSQIKIEDCYFKTNGDIFFLNLGNQRNYMPYFKVRKIVSYKEGLARIILHLIDPLLVIKIFKTDSPLFSLLRKKKNNTLTWFWNNSPHS